MELIRLEYQRKQEALGFCEPFCFGATLIGRVLVLEYLIYMCFLVKLMFEVLFCADVLGNISEILAAYRMGFTWMSQEVRING